MSRIVPIPCRKLVRVLEIEGFALVRERGDHMVFSKNVLRTAHISRERYLELLGRV